MKLDHALENWIRKAFKNLTLKIKDIVERKMREDNKTTTYQLHSWLVTT